VGNKVGNLAAVGADGPLPERGNSLTAEVQDAGSHMGRKVSGCVSERLSTARKLSEFPVCEISI
jgi:hypothetical protein